MTTPGPVAGRAAPGAAARRAGRGAARLARRGAARLARRGGAWLARAHPDLWSDIAPSPAEDDDDRRFVEQLFEQMLGRAADPDGLEGYLLLLSEGATRAEVVMRVAGSAEYRYRLCPQPRREGPLQRHPQRYSYHPGPGILTLDLEGPDDFDWIERTLLADSYYERPGVWNFEVDLDKRVMAETVALLARRRVLELGCSSGAVLDGLHRRGLDFVGVDISTLALEHAIPAVKDRIRLGDLLELELGSDFDTAFGLDIFEHLNPNRLALYIRRLKACLVPGGMLFANIPAFGRDEVFGEVFAPYLPSWDDDAAHHRPFHQLHVDEWGYPMHGHLIWADANWWTAQFEGEGFVRRRRIEAALHHVYDDYLRASSPARLSFFVFSAGDVPDEPALVERIARSVSGELARLRPT